MPTFEKLHPIGWSFFGSMSIVGVETKQEMIDRVGEKSSGTIFMYGRKGFSF